MNRSLVLIILTREVFALPGYMSTAIMVGS